MTLCYWYFYDDPEKKRRLNYNVLGIGDPAVGKAPLERIEALLTEPMDQSDQLANDAINNYKENSLAKGANKDKEGKPKVIVRKHGARTSNNVFINDMVNAWVEVDGERMQMHMLTTDSEALNSIKMQKGGQWIDKNIMEIKAWSNEKDSQQYANLDSVSGPFYVYWNLVRTCTPPALKVLVNERNFGSGYPLRLYAIPVPDKGFDMIPLRRKSQIDEDVEYYGFVRAMRAIDRADVAILVIDGTLGLTDQDQRVAKFAQELGCAMVIVLNKWDIVDGPERKAEIRERIEDRLTYVGYAPVIAISALTGKNVHRIWGAIDKAYENYSKTIPTNQLNTWLAEIREEGHTVSQGKAVLRMKYVTQTGNCPPVFTFFANRPDLLTDNYERFLENRMRKHFDLEGTPIRFKFKKKD